MTGTSDQLLTVRDVAGRRHPDIFTVEEAAEYLHVQSAETVKWLEDKHKLVSHLVGKMKLYDRRDLDAAWRSVCGISEKAAPSQGMKLNLG